MNELFSTPEPDDDDPDMKRFYDEPVTYEGMLVSRSTAYRLCMNEHRCWRSMDRVTKLPRSTVSPGKAILGLEAAFLASAQAQYPSNPGRDV